MMTRPSRPTARAPPPPSGQPLGEAGRFRDESVGIDREAEQFWELADEDREGEAVHVADLGRLGQQVGHEAQLGDAGEHGHHPDPSASIEASATALRIPLAPTMGMMVAAIMGPSEESGPSTRTLEGPRPA